jgi:hypothetical protein
MPFSFDSSPRSLVGQAVSIINVIIALVGSNRTRTNYHLVLVRVMHHAITGKGASLFFTFTNGLLRVQSQSF